MGACCTGKNNKWDDRKIKLMTMNVQQKSKTYALDSGFVILQIGLFPWQSQFQSTCNSAILHELHHNAINSIDGCVSYSIWPSVQQMNTDATLNNNVRIYEVDEIPSITKWSSKSQLFINKFQSDLQDLIYDFMIDIEKDQVIDISVPQHKQNTQYQKISLIICHHPFINNITISNVMERRKENGLNIDIKIASILHGDILKIYEYELDANNNQYTSNFYQQMSDLQLFESNISICGNVDLVYSISTEITHKFTQLFPKFDTKNLIYSTPGYNPIFRKLADNLSLTEVLQDVNVQLKTVEIIETDEHKKSSEQDGLIEYDKIYKNYKYLVIFAGGLAEWKRIECLIYAAKEYEKYFGDNEIITLIVGNDMEEFEKENVRLQTLNNKFGNKNVYFVGGQSANILVKLYNVCDIGVFPMKDEQFALDIIECLACGTPVIATNSGHSADFVDDIVGKLIEENDDNKMLAQTFANAVVDSIKNNDKAKKSNNCIKVAEPYGIKAKVEIMLKNTKQIYYF